jgi:predicted nuclease of predicted toxin-antitoxin system
MSKYLIDVNLPSRFSMWATAEYEHVVNINDEMKDSQIWHYAKEHNLTIVTKDTDFSDMIMISTPPPKVIHIKIGNMKMKEFHQLISKNWQDICSMSEDFKLIRVFSNKIEGID